VRLDPFRIQVWTLSIDSQIVLTVVGLVVAGLLVRQAARQLGDGLSAADWWDLVFSMAVGGRLVWVITHAEYFLRQPLQVAVIVDGGLSVTGFALGAIFWVWRFGRGGDALAWRIVVDLVAIGILTTALFERVGCALTTCGTGPTSDLPWAILRGDGWHAPIGLAQVVLLAVALSVAAELLRVRGAAFLAMLAGLVLAEAVAATAERASADTAVALAVLVASYAAIWWYPRAAAVTDAGRPGSDGTPTGTGARAR
jgi:prolipoprotein diacylglyceryltransferase